MSAPAIIFLQVGFRHYKDYQAYVWAKAEHATQVSLSTNSQICFELNSEILCLVFSPQVTFSEEDLPRDDCEYILGYYSHNMNSIVGLSSPIQVTRIIEQREANAFLLVMNRFRYTGTIISHFIRYVFLAPGLGHSYAFRHALILIQQGAAKHSFEIWVHIDVIGSHS